VTSPARRAGDRDPEAHRIALSIGWRGPWGRLADLIASPGVGRNHAWRAELARYADQREAAWLAEYVVRGTEPPVFWRKRNP
jgi:LPS sulfotransferase NodH